MENPCTNCIHGLVHPSMELCPVCLGTGELFNNETTMSEETPEAVETVEEVAPDAVEEAAPAEEVDAPAEEATA